MSTNIKWSYQKKFQNGEVVLNTGMVLGYKKSSTGEYVIAEDEAETVLRIYREYLCWDPCAADLPRAGGRRHHLQSAAAAQWRPNAVLGHPQKSRNTPATLSSAKPSSRTCYPSAG